MSPRCCLDLCTRRPCTLAPTLLSPGIPTLTFTPPPNPTRLGIHMPPTTASTPGSLRSPSTPCLSPRPPASEPARVPIDSLGHLPGSRPSNQNSYLVRRPALQGIRREFRDLREFATVDGRRLLLDVRLDAVGVAQDECVVGGGEGGQGKEEAVSWEGLESGGGAGATGVV
ncbi:hypothetical protein BV22DRAFT_1135796 [Leucogyrophana mollusca]|uniref:Uncharacterized protein n=1 Tax=Leucogyrophana mollusca TaxID=85980 RepID=A0ACB8AUT7_9AGAM|nr:hypothetical protein BV22DRAFT_1135796 [Leucogyrophana mollusca]